MYVAWDHTAVTLVHACLVTLDRDMYVAWDHTAVTLVYACLVTLDRDMYVAWDHTAVTLVPAGVGVRFHLFPPSFPSSTPPTTLSPTVSSSLVPHSRTQRRWASLAASSSCARSTPSSRWTSST